MGVSSVSAMTYSTRELPEGKLIIFASGKITEDDATAFSQDKFCASSHLPCDPDPVVTVVFNSRGGDIGAAVDIAHTIRRRGCTTGVANGGVCASACAIAFAAGKTKAVGRDARIGVHSAIGAASLRDADEEVLGGVGTGVVAKTLEQYGAPSSVVNAARSTPASEIHWLTPGELVQWKVEAGSSALEPPVPEQN
jgi:hypothetical protein